MSQPHAVSLVPMSLPEGPRAPSPRSTPHPSPELCLLPPPPPPPPHPSSLFGGSSMRATRVPTHAHPLVSARPRVPLRAAPRTAACCDRNASLRSFGSYLPAAALPPAFPCTDLSTAPCSRSSVIRLRALRSNPRKPKVTPRPFRCSPALPKAEPPTAARRGAVRGTDGLRVRELNL